VMVVMMGIIVMIVIYGGVRGDRASRVVRVIIIMQVGGGQRSVAHNALLGITGICLGL